MVSRRRFLRTAAVAATLPLVWSRSAHAAPASDRLTVGFIGVGTMGRGHLAGILGDNDVEVVAVCDVVKERIDDAAQIVTERYSERTKSGNYSGVKSYADYRELIAHPGLDAVLIATPDHWHANLCILAARAGKHIYCEKPLTHNIAEGRRIVDEVAKARVVFQTGSQQRSEFSNYFRQAVEYIWNGRIGKVQVVRIGVGGPSVPCDLPAMEIPTGTDWNMWLGPAPERGYHEILCPLGVHRHFPAWRNYREYAGGALADMGAHHFDIAQWALEMDDSGPVQVIPPEHPDKGHGLQFEYSTGVIMIHNEFDGDATADCVFEGTDGIILVSRSGISSRPESILKEPLTAQDRRVYPSNHHRRNWLDCIRNGKTTICPAEIGNRSATICHLANIGYRVQRKLNWNPKLERFVGDDEANKLLTREPREKWKV